MRSNASRPMRGLTHASRTSASIASVATRGIGPFVPAFR
jgi:hypothetical protein